MGNADTGVDADGKMADEEDEKMGVGLGKAAALVLPAVAVAFPPPLPEANDSPKISATEPTGPNIKPRTPPVELAPGERLAATAAGVPLLLALLVQSASRLGETSTPPLAESSRRDFPRNRLSKSSSLLSSLM